MRTKVTCIVETRNVVSCIEVAQALEPLSLQSAIIIQDMDIYYPNYRIEFLFLHRENADKMFLWRGAILTEKP